MADKIKFRKLTAAEIDCRIATISEKGCSLLLYKDARVDQNLLDEVFGLFGWQRKHEVIDGQLFCTVSVKDPESGEWVSKQDVGTESYTEKEKGRASDSFKRACFNLGIGRELYTAPFIWVSECERTQKNGKWTTNDKFEVKEIGYDKSGNINTLTIINSKTKKVVYEMGKPFKAEKKAEPKNEDKPKTDDKPKHNTVSSVQLDSVIRQCEKSKVSPLTICDKLHLSCLENMTEEQYQYLTANWSKEFANAV